MSKARLSTLTGTKRSLLPHAVALGRSDFNATTFMTKHITLLLALVSALGTASAAEQLNGHLADVDMPQSTWAAPRSRAEVIADLQIYRRSGLAALESSESPDTFSKSYYEAQARYFAMRNSAEFKQLVARIASARGETQATAGRMPEPMQR